jgi:hypothetical protein
MKILVIIERSPQVISQELILPGQVPPTQQQAEEVIQMTFGTLHEYEVVDGSFSPTNLGKKW